jgi:hypothetical protein
MSEFFFPACVVGIVVGCVALTVLGLSVATQNRVLRFRFRRWAIELDIKPSPLGSKRDQSDDPSS